MKAEIDTVKMIFKAVLSLQISVKYTKEDIQQLTVTHTDIAERLKHVEEEIHYETDDDYDSEINTSLSQLKNKLKSKSHGNEKGQDLICDNCDFVRDTVLLIRKHTKTRHSIRTTEDKEINTIRIDGTLEGIEDLFQLKVIDGEHICGCNVCD